MRRLIDDAGGDWTRLGDLILGVAAARASGVLASPLQVILVAFVLAAVITPSPDIVTQSVYATPLIGAYALGVVLVRLTARKLGRPRTS